ncbi:uncharacterized protein FPRN_07260 [Fusarium proliferatum]|nr:uncharacterized protein FPRN_07260 [Fusarium proliferatum]
MVKGIRGVLVDDLFWFQEELGIETSDFMRALFDQEWLQYRTAACVNQRKVADDGDQALIMKKHPLDKMMALYLPSSVTASQS